MVSLEEGILGGDTYGGTGQVTSNCDNQATAHFKIIEQRLFGWARRERFCESPKVMDTTPGQHGKDWWRYVQHIKLGHVEGLKLKRFP